MTYKQRLRLYSYLYKYNIHIISILSCTIYSYFKYKLKKIVLEKNTEKKLKKEYLLNNFPS